MRDEDNPQPAFLEPTDDGEERPHLVIGERRSRLVHDNDARIVGKGFGDLDHLLLGNTEITHHAPGSRSTPTCLRYSRAESRSLPAIDEAGAVWLAADEDVLFHRHIGKEIEFLIDDRNRRACWAWCGLLGMTMCPSMAIVPSSGA